MLILIVEDEAAIARFLERGLNAHATKSSARTMGRGGASGVTSRSKLVLLDISLPRLAARGAQAHPSPGPQPSGPDADGPRHIRNKVGASCWGRRLLTSFRFEELLARPSADPPLRTTPVGAIQTDDPE